MIPARLTGILNAKQRIRVLLDINFKLYVDPSINMETRSMLSKE